MIRFLAIDFNQAPIAAVCARIQREKPIEIVSVGSIELEQQTESVAQYPPRLAIDLPDGGFDRADAVLGTSALVYTSLELPFNDPKKVAQIVPLELQDSLPFDVSSFVIDTQISARSKGSDFTILATLAESESVANSLSTMSGLGVDPVRLSTQASTLAQLYLLCLQDEAAISETEIQVVVNVQENFVAVVIFNAKLVHSFREWQRDPAQDDMQSTLAEIAASMQAAESELELPCGALYVLGSSEILARFDEHFNIPVKMLDLSTVVENHTDSAIALDKYCWAIGLAAQEAKSLESATDVDFRKGPFAYRRAWSDFWEALKDEMTWFVLAIVFTLGFIGTKWWAQHHQLEVVESEITRLSRAAYSEGIVPKRGEVQFFEELLQDRENQLLEMGSLASLSPLESLKLLSDTIAPTISVEVDAITIGFSRVLLRGSVRDTPTLGTLESALKMPSSKFCSVKVDPKGRVSGSSRVKFSAEIEVCE